MSPWSGLIPKWVNRLIGNARAVLFGLIVLQALLYSSFYLRELAWYPPDNFDQAFTWT